MVFPPFELEVWMELRLAHLTDAGGHNSSAEIYDADRCGTAGVSVTA